MSIIVPQPPEGGLGRIREAVGRLMSQPNTRTAAVTAGAVAGDLEAAVPHPVYFVRADYLAAGSLLAAAELSGWRYILLAGGRAILAAELSFGREGGGLEFSHTNDGPLVAGTVEGVRVAERLEVVGEAEFELRLLEIPSLSVAVLWFHAEVKDLLMPIPPSRRGLRPFTIYTEGELLKALGGAAAERLQFVGDRA
jgi:hypothetical protein